MTTHTRAVARIETTILAECDGGDSFASMLEGWLEQHKHWMNNGYAADLINQTRDFISETRGEIEKGRESASQDAHDTAGDHKRSAA